MDNLTKLTTESCNPKSINLDQMAAGDILNLMNEEDLSVPHAIRKVLPEIEKAVEAICRSFNQGGRLIYVGAGTSGRIGLLDAVECPPTFGTDAEPVQAVLAGGNDALMFAVEGAEDDEQLGEGDLKERGIGAKDVVIGIAASGRTPYVKAALRYAQSKNAVTVSLTSNSRAEISAYADIPIEIITGPEVLTGSTRLKAATAHKMVLNMISTAAMVKTGKTYRNLMVDVNASNHKLRERANKIVQEATGADYRTASEVLHRTDFAVKPAIVMLLTGVDFQASMKLLDESKGFVREAIKENEGIDTKRNTEEISSFAQKTGTIT